VKVKRVDIGVLGKPQRRADGTMIVQARFARTGVQVYRNMDGSERREYRPDTAVFDRASLDSFKLVPVTNDHPPDMLTADNIRQYSVGTVGQDVHRDGKWMVGSIVIHDAATIRDMENGKTEVSNGYEADLDMTPGISPDGERYDCVQTNILGNHLAIVHNARAGKDAAVRMDAAFNDDTQLEVYSMELAEALQELGKQKARADQAVADLATMKSRADKLEGERDEAKLKADKAEQARKDAVDAAPKQIRARMDLEQKASSILGKEFKMDGATDRKVKCAVIKHISNVDVADDKSDDYVSARYDAALERAEASKDAFVEVQTAIDRNHADTGPNRADAAKTEMIKRQHTFIQPK
jgi:hypothetical protein